MRLHNFFIEQKIAGKEIIIKDKNVLDQWRKVLRLKVGNEVVLLDNSGFEFKCLIKSLEQKEATLSVLEKIEKSWNPNFDLELIPSVIKKDKFEWVLEKGTELGVSKFSPILSERSIKQNLNFERAEKILKESSEQSGRSKLPEIGNIKTLKIFLDNLDSSKKYIALDSSGKAFSKKEISEDEKVGVFIGPEGGFDEKELEMFKEENILIYSLGSQILRAETASIAFASILLIG